MAKNYSLRQDNEGHLEKQCEDGKESRTKAWITKTVLRKCVKTERSGAKRQGQTGLARKNEKNVACLKLSCLFQEHTLCCKNMPFVARTCPLLQEHALCCTNMLTQVPRATSEHKTFGCATRASSW
jgi:hypothetical protein